ncbi:MAG: hypothetical protein WEC84_01595 [Candidatus Andersenbacteria bacterium]
MKKIVVYIIIGLLLLIGLGILASQVGNVGIRRVRNSQEIALEVSQPVVPGVEVAIHWTLPANVTNQNIELRLRTQSADTALGYGKISDEVTSVVVPCSAGGQRGSLHMRDLSTGELLAWTPMAVLSAGPDCL